MASDNLTFLIGGTGLVRESVKGFGSALAELSYEISDSITNRGWLDFTESLSNSGITAGCGEVDYCPNAPVTRAQMAVFLLRAKYGSDHTPPSATGVFNDVDLSHWAVHWIEQLAAEGITAGCGNNSFCPTDPVTRAQMAVFLVRTFGLL